MARHAAVRGRRYTGYIYIYIYIYIFSDTKKEQRVYNMGACGVEDVVWAAPSASLVLDALLNLADLHPFSRDGPTKVTCTALIDAPTSMVRVLARARTVHQPDDQPFRLGDVLCTAASCYVEQRCRPTEESHRCSTR